MEEGKESPRVGIRPKCSSTKNTGSATWRPLPQRECAQIAEASFEPGVLTGNRRPDKAIFSVEDGVRRRDRTAFPRHGLPGGTGFFFCDAVSGKPFFKVRVFFLPLSTRSEHAHPKGFSTVQPYEVQKTLLLLVELHRIVVSPAMYTGEQRQRK